MKTKRINDLISESLAMEAEEAKEAGALAFMARALVQATLPHSQQENNEFVRTNGAFSITMLAPSAVGLPYGSIPRLLMAWLTTEAVRTKSPHIELGHNLSDFMSELGMQSATGGRWGSITRLREQINRLFRCYISCSYDLEEDRDKGRNILMVEEFDLWWSPKAPDQGLLWNSEVLLNSSFFKEIVNKPVPVDMRALKALKKSPLALDIYCWLTYRMSYLRNQTNIPWEVLMLQFGADYEDTPQGKRNFKKEFLRQLKAVQIIYPLANVEPTTKHLILSRSHTHVKGIRKLTH